MAGQTLRGMMTEYRREKIARYEQFEALLSKALAAGRAAAQAMPGSTELPERMMDVRLRLLDGRGSFARFIRQQHADSWQHGNWRTGIYLRVSEQDYSRAVAFAEAMREVLLGGGINVTIENHYIAGPE